MGGEVKKSLKIPPSAPHLTQRNNMAAAYIHLDPFPLPLAHAMVMVQQQSNRQAPLYSTFSRACAVSLAIVERFLHPITAAAAVLPTAVFSTAHDSKCLGWT